MKCIRKVDTALAVHCFVSPHAIRWLLQSIFVRECLVNVRCSRPYAYGYGYQDAIPPTSRPLDSRSEWCWPGNEAAAEDITISAEDSAWRVWRDSQGWKKPSRILSKESWWWANRLHMPSLITRVTKYIDVWSIWAVGRFAMLKIWIRTWHLFSCIFFLLLSDWPLCDYWWHQCQRQCQSDYAQVSLVQQWWLVLIIRSSKTGHNSLC